MHQASASSRLPVVHQPRYPATSPSMHALVTTARRGAALMAAGAVARLVFKQLVPYLLRSQAPVPARRDTSVATTASQPMVMEEVIYVRRRVYRR